MRSPGEWHGIDHAEERVARVSIQTKRAPLSEGGAHAAGIGLIDEFNHEIACACSAASNRYVPP